MVTITSPKDIIWAEIKVNSVVNDIINGINDSLSKNNAFLSNEFNYTVELENKLSQRDMSLLRFAFSEFGWNIVSTSSSKDKNVEYIFRLMVSNPIFL